MPVREAVLRLLVLLLFGNVRLDKVLIVADLVLGDAHVHQLLQQRLERRVRVVEGKRNIAVPVRLLGHGRRGGVICVGQVRDVRVRDVGAEACVRAWGALGLCVSLAGLDLLVEAGGLLLVGEGEAGHARFELEGVEEGAVVVVLEAVVELLVPDDAFVALFP